MNNHYKIGLAAITDQRGQVRGFRVPATTVGVVPEGVGGALVIAGLIAGGVLLLKRKPPRATGPDTRDIAASLRARGRDPYKYML